MTNNGLFQLKTGSVREVNVKVLLMKYLRYWYLFLLGAVICGGLAYFHVRYRAVPQYRIAAKLMIKDGENGSGNGMESFKELGIFNTSRNIDNEVDVLRSTNLMGKVLNALSMRVKYLVKGQFRDTEIYGEDLPVKVMINESEPVLSGIPVKLHIKDNKSFELIEEDAQGNISKSQHGFGQEIRKPYGTFTVVAGGSLSLAHTAREIVFVFQDLEALAESYSTRLSISPGSKAGSVLNISLVDPIPAKGVDILNKLIEVYNLETIDDKNQLAVNTIELIDERMKHLTSELTDVEKNVEEYKQKNDLTDVSSEAQLYLERASEYNRQLAEYEIQIDVLNSIESYLKKQGDELELVPSSLNIQDPTLLGLISKFNELQLERQRMLRTTQRSNPLVLDLDEQLFNLRGNILENLRNIKNGLVITQRNLQASSQRFESRIQKVPSIQRELLEISRQQSIKEGLYLYLLQKREEAALSLVAAVSNSRVIEPAKASWGPISPNVTSIYLAAILLGLSIPFAGIFLKETLNDKVEYKKDVQEITAVPVLGEIAHNSVKQALVVSERNRSPVAELFRLIRTNLKFATAGKENKVILITSGMSGEGKTFFSINLGASLALSGKKVVILSFDLRKPRLMDHLGLSNDQGITNYLINPELPLDKIVLSSGLVKGMFLIGSGPVPHNPGELMLSERVAVLINELKLHFDHIIIDSAPVGQVADAYALSDLVDSTIYMVRYNFTTKRQLEIIDEIYRSKTLKYPMIVLNDARKKNGYGYGYGYGYQSDLDHQGGKKNAKSVTA